MSAHVLKFLIFLCRTLSTIFWKPAWASLAMQFSPSDILYCFLPSFLSLFGRLWLPNMVTQTSNLVKAEV